jgi:hypothetical protein
LYVRVRVKFADETSEATWRRQEGSEEMGGYLAEGSGYTEDSQAEERRKAIGITEKRRRRTSDEQVR